MVSVSVSFKEPQIKFHEAPVGTVFYLETDHTTAFMKINPVCLKKSINTTYNAVILGAPNRQLSNIDNYCTIIPCDATITLKPQFNYEV